MASSPRSTFVPEAIALAEAWQDRANQLLTDEEKKRQQRMQRLLNHPLDKVILTKMIDQSFRSSNCRRVADQLNSLLRRYGIPSFFSAPERMLAKLFLAIGRHLPDLSIPKMIERIRADSSRAIIPGEQEALKAHLDKRRGEGIRMNINHLGEAVLGEGEAQARLETYLLDLKSPDIEYISVKISTIYSQIQSLAFEHTVRILEQRLGQLYRTAQAHLFVRPDGTRTPKFVNLDMEEYRDLEITTAAFMRTLDKPEFKHHATGIVLQAYLPDALGIQRQLTRWARQRVSNGGSPIKIRLVKGANMEMELVEAALHNWPLAPYDNKLDVDANYKRMVTHGMQLENIKAAHLGIASHNLFELAYAFKLAEKNGVIPYMTFEMLEGMADHVRRAIQQMSGEVLLYAPVATKDQFINAIAYLIRRLDENTAEDNFLRYSFDLTTDSSQWRFLKQQFVDACIKQDQTGTMSHRRQDRLTEIFAEKMGTFYEGEFKNEPDTDWSLAANRKWAEAIRDKWRPTGVAADLKIPVVVGGEEHWDQRQHKTNSDPNRRPEDIVLARFALATEADVAQAVATAKADPDSWRAKSYNERHAILARVAQEIRTARGDLIGAAAADTGKVFSEADVEVSEAVDFAEFYPFTAQSYANQPNLRCRGKGVGLVITPWNFPIAIPCGGLTAALAAGNTVIFKPASAAVLVAWQLCQLFWQAGVSRNTLQFVPCEGGTTGRQLTVHPDVDFIILTGGTDTGMAILRERPDAALAAETGGKNATIVTAMADRDQAIKNVIHSAFSNCGQKCSATSLLILEKEVFEDPHFKQQLVDAARSYLAGSAWEFQNKMGPLIQAPRGDLLRALTRLEPGESWVLKPRNLNDNPLLWTPGIKWDVQSGSYTHITEFFGPVLGVMRARDLAHAIELANQPGYGLTAGIESLDEREIQRWRAGIIAGNLYVNRGTTGAIVLRQPFGGLRKSALGAGIKAGSPNYVAQFMAIEETGCPPVGAIRQAHPLLRLAQEWELKVAGGAWAEYKQDLLYTARAIKSYLYQYEQEFAQPKDYFHLRGQDNLFGYLPAGTAMVRLHPEDSLFEALARIAAALIARCTVQLSSPPDLDGPAAAFLRSRHARPLLAKVHLTQDSDAQVAAQLAGIHRLRYAAPERVAPEVYQAAAARGFYISRQPVLMEGRLELLNYLQEQSICHNYHRYGNLGERSLTW